MSSSRWSGKHTLTYEQVYKIVRMINVDKVRYESMAAEERAIAKRLRIKPEQVKAIREARNHKDYIIEAVASLGREGLIDG